MKYMFMLVRDDEQWEGLEDQGADMEKINGWFMNLAQQGKLSGGDQLQPARTATTVRFDGGRPLVTDGPFMESKETIGGYGIVEAEDLDEALSIAKTWPARAHVLEIRPVVASDHPR